MRDPGVCMCGGGGCALISARSVMCISIPVLKTGGRNALTLLTLFIEERNN